MADTKFKFEAIIKSVKTEKNVLARIIANDIKNYYVASFTKQSWNGKKWEEVQRRIKGTKEYKYPKTRGLSRRTKPILIGRAILRRAVAGSIKQATFNRITWNVSLPYAEVQNNGGKHIAARKYMGWNKDTDRIVKDDIKAWEEKLFKSQFR